MCAAEVLHYAGRVPSRIWYQSSCGVRACWPGPLLPTAIAEALLLRMSAQAGLSLIIGYKQDRVTVPVLISSMNNVFLGPTIISPATPHPSSAPSFCTICIPKGSTDLNCAINSNDPVRSALAGGKQACHDCQSLRTACPQTLAPAGLHTLQMKLSLLKA